MKFHLWEILHTTQITPKMSSIRYSIAVLAFLILAVSAHCQVTTNGASGLAASYPSLADAIMALNAATISAPIIIDVNADQTAPAGGYIITAQGTAANTITLRGNNNTILGSNAQIPGKYMDAIFRLEGADYLTLEQFVMMENPSATNVSDGTNTVTEWGIALLAASVTNGCQYNIIRNNIISLRVSALDRNTFGIYSNVRHSTTSFLIGTDPTVFSGTNSHNKIHNNTITNVNFGISFTGSGVGGNFDTDNELGGPVAGTGNRITEFGKAKTSVMYASHPDLNFGIQSTNQINEIISNNTLISNDITSSGSFTGARGIYKVFTADPTGTTTTTISKNLLTLTYSATLSDLMGIHATGSGTAPGLTLNITDNSLIKCKLATTSSTTFLTGIFNAANVGILNITGNLIRGCMSATTGGTITGISNGGSVVSSINISNNLFGNEEGPAALLTGTTAPGFSGISNFAGGGMSAVSISGNQFYGINYATTVSVSVNFITVSGASIPSVIISNNLFRNIVLNTSSSVYFIRRSSNSPANCVYIVTGNEIVGTFSKSGTAGDIFLFETASGASAGANSSMVISNNNFSNITSFGTSRIAGFTYGMGQSCTITDNVLSNWTAGGNSGQGNLGITVTAATIVNISRNILSNFTNPFAFIGINNTGTGISAVLDSNLLSGITAVASMTGLNYGGSHTIATISRNTLQNLTSTSSTITAMQCSVNSGSTTSSIFRNKIYGIQTNFSAGIVTGLRLGKGSTNNGPCTVHNNYIGDLKAPLGNADNMIRAIDFGSSSDASDYNFYFNTVYLNATGAGGSFGTSILTTSVGTNFIRLDLRNNIFVNSSTPNGAGLTSVFRNIGLTPELYKTSTNSNVLYAGVPGSQRVILYNSESIKDQTLSAFQARIYPADVHSVSELPTFISTDGTSADFLHINTSVATRIESGGLQVAGITSDFDGVIRAGNMGYTGTGTLPDIGADEGDFILVDVVGPRISYTPLVNTVSLTNTNLSNVSISDISNVEVSGGLKPRVYFKKKSQANTYNDNTNATDGWKYVEANGTTSPFDFDLDYALLNGGSPMVGDTIQYFVIAQDMVMTPNVGFLAGLLTLTPVSVALDASHFPLTNSINAYVIKASIEGIKTVCASGCDYPTLTNTGGIFEAINNAIVTDSLTIRIEGDLTVELGTHSLNAYTINKHILIRPFGGMHRTISGTAANGTPLIGLNGADNVTIDGIRSGGDSLTISNLSTSISAGTSTIRFSNGASGNSILRCRVLGSSLVPIGSGGGVVFFNHTTTGNSNNLIEDCDLGPAGANLPNVMIYSFNSTAHTNNIITGNRLYDFFSPTKSSAGIYLETGTGWSILNNKLYQTATRTFANNSFTHSGIVLSGGSGSQIINNTIGYNDSNSTGVYSIVGLASSKWYPVDVSAGTASAPTEIQGNRISSLSFTGPLAGATTTAPLVIFRILGGVVNIGTVTGNIIGDSLTNANISYSSSSSTINEIIGFYISGATTKADISNNHIGGITAALSGTGGTGIYGIQTVTNAILKCRFNTIGGQVANSLQSLSSNNAFVRGISNLASTASFISDNVIRNLSSNSSISGSVNLAGIFINSSSADTIVRNRIYNLSGTTVSSVAVNNIGIHVQTSTGVGFVATIDRNQIHSFETLNSSQTIVGIRLSQGNNTCSNNMIRLGLKIDGSSMTIPSEIFGIVDETGSPKLFHNSIYIGGTGVLSSSFTTAAFKRSNTAVYEIRNNIFSNGRQNASTGAKHYNLQFFSGTMSNNLNHNIYFNTGGNGNVFAFYSSGDVLSLQAWIALALTLNRFVDQNSYAENPHFSMAAGSSSTGDLHILPGKNSIAEARGNPLTEIVLDIDGQSRSITPDIGADEGDFVSPLISYERMNETVSLSNRTLSNVSITAQSGVNISMGTKPRVYYKKKTDPNDATGWKFMESSSLASPFSFEIDYALLNAGMVMPLDTIQYFVIAQDLAMTPHVAMDDGNTSSVPTSVNLGVPEFPIIEMINSYPIKAEISGTKTICASGCDYTSLTNTGGVFNDINTSIVAGNLLLEVRDNLLAETGTHPLNAFTPGYAVTIRPAGGLTRVVSGASVAGKALIDFNGADSVMVDGRNIGGDSLFITNTSTSGTTGTSTVQFRNDSRSCTVRNCTISGSSTALFSGTVYISSIAIATGNDNIMLVKNTIGAAGGITPTNAIYVSGSTPINNHIVIDSNYIKDYFAANGVCAGLIVGGSCLNVLISNNHFFQTAPRVKIGGSTHVCIQASSGAIITGNVIGGSDPSHGGIYSITGVANTKVYPIILLTSVSTESAISGNIIKSIAISGAMSGNAVSTSPFTGIFVNSGIVNVTDNIIGDTSALGSITYSTTSTSGSLVVGICNASGGNLTTTHNKIGGISLIEGSTGGIDFRGITAAATTLYSWTCKHNSIGGNIPGSIQNNTTTANRLMDGLFSAGAISIVDSNTIRNLKSALFRGIVMNGGSGHSIRYNEIYNMQNSTSHSSGIYLNVGSTSFTNVVGNKIHSLVPGLAFLQVNGIQVQTGSVNIVNNMIRLGLYADGTSIEASGAIAGIYLVSTTTEANIYFNSIYIGGSVTGTTATNSYGARIENSVKNIRNNIFYNARSNVTTGGKHYALSLSNFTGLVEDNNIYHVTGTNGFLASIVSVDKTTIDGIRTSTFQDVQSQAVDPKFINPTGNATLFDLHIDATVISPAEGNGVAILGYDTDYDNAVRSSLSPTDIGADAGNFMGEDRIPPVITYSDLTVDYAKASRAFSNVQITDANGIETTAGLRPRLYFKKSTDPNTDAGWKYVEANGTTSPFDFTINYSLLNAGSVSAGDLIHYFVVAADAVAMPNVGKNTAIFTVTPASVALMTAQFPVSGTVKSYAIVDTLSGTKTVCASGCDFSSLTNNNASGAFKAINDRILTGNLLLQITSDLIAENGAITLSAFAAPFTVTIKPEGGPRLVSNNTAASLIILNGADRVIIDGSLNNTINTLCPLTQATRDLTFKNLSTGASIINLRSAPGNPSTNNVIKNCNIEGNATSATVFGIASTDQTVTTSSLGKDNDNNSYINNAISKVQFGIYSQGENRSNKNQGTIIQLNNIDLTSSANTAVAGIFLGFENNVQLSGNTIRNISNSTRSVAGIVLGLLPSTNSNVFTGNDVTNSLISQNTVRDISRIGDGSAFGISMAAVISGGASTNELSNNVLFQINSTAATTMDYVAAILVGGGAVGTTKIFHNTIRLAGVSSFSAPAFSMAIGTINPAIEMKNNIFVNEMTSTLGKNYALGLAYSGSYSNLNSNRNNFFTPGAPIAIAGGLNNSPSGDLANLAAYQTLTGKDLNSKNVLPEFVSSTDLHLTAGAINIANLDAKGAPVPVAVDIDCDMRHATTPDIGADEIIGCDNPMITSVSADVNPIPCSGNATNLMVAGNLNQGTEWKWYTGSCGGTLVGSGLTIEVMPEASGMYYVRGEGGCTSDGPCDSISISITGSIITNTNNAGAGSLREAITCAGDGDTLVFDPDVLDAADTIIISSAALIIGKDIFIDQGPAAIVKIKTTGTHPVFSINAGSFLNLRNVKLFVNAVNPAIAGRAIFNQGMLTLHNVDIFERDVNASGIGSTVQNQPGSILTIIAGCQLKIQ